MSRVSFNLVFAAVCAVILLANGSPIDSQVENEIIVCPEGATNGYGVAIYPRELRCSMVGGMCVESDKCSSLVSAKGLCPNNQYRGVECCFELEQSYVPCQQP